jgi:hypothetical protein
MPLHPEIFIQQQQIPKVIILFLIAQVAWREEVI